MLKHCILHVGLHKTGSTSIQTTLHSHLDDENFTYADLGSANHSVRIFSLFTDKPEEYHVHKKRALSLKEIEKFNHQARKMLIENIDSCTSENMIISAEDISSLSKAGVERLKKFLEEHFQKITVVAYVRPPFSLMESSFQQRLKGGLQKAFNIQNLYPRYGKKLRKFDVVFGKENVHLWKFDPKIFFGGDVVSDFCHRLNIKLDPGHINRTNEALSKEALSLLYIYRKFGSGYGSGKKVIGDNAQFINKLRSIGDTKPRFSSKLMEPVVQSNLEDMKWIEERMSVSFLEEREDKETDITSESDLLHPDPSTVEALRQLIGKDLLPVGIKGETVEEVAELIHALRMKV